MERDTPDPGGGGAVPFAPVSDMGNGLNPHIVGQSRQGRADGGGYGVAPEIGTSADDFRPTVAAQTHQPGGGPDSDHEAPIPQHLVFRPDVERQGRIARLSAHQKPARRTQDAAPTEGGAPSQAAIEEEPVKAE